MQEIPYRIGVLLSSYAQAINRQNGTTGSLFQQKTKAKCVTPTGRDVLCDLNGGGNMRTNNHLITCLHYIHQNPRKAKLVDRMEDWRYSSFRAYLGMEILLPCNRELVRAMTGYTMASFYEDSYQLIDKEALENIW